MCSLKVWRRAEGGVAAVVAHAPTKSLRSESGELPWSVLVRVCVNVGVCGWVGAGVETRWIAASGMSQVSVAHVDARVLGAVVPQAVALGHLEAVLAIVDRQLVVPQVRSRHRAVQALITS